MVDADKLRPAREVLDEIMDAGDMGSACDRDPCKQCDVAIAVIEADRKQCLAALQAHADALAGAVSKLKLRDLVAGWNGENREAGPFEPHPAKLRITLTTNAGIVYALDEALRAYEAFKAGEPT